MQSWKYSTFPRVEFQVFTTFFKITVILAFATFLNNVFYVVFNVFNFEPSL